MKQEEYKELLKSLLPPGAAWKCEDGSEKDRLLSALAMEFERFDQRMDDLVEEADPRTTIELLPDWERVTGLPDVCSKQEPTTQERRSALVARLTNIGNQSKQFFLDLAEGLGYEISIHEYRPFRIGHSSIMDPLNDEEWIFVWEVNAPETTIREFQIGHSTIMDPLRSWGNELLECVFGRLKPANTYLIFTYGG